MAIEKIIKCKKDHKCGYCDKIINKGEYAFYMAGKELKYLVEQFGASACEKQTGINYYKVWYCYDNNTEQWPSCAINN